MSNLSTGRLSLEWITLETKLPAIVLIEKDEVTLDLYRRELSTSFEVFSFTEIDDVLETVANQDIQAVIIEPEIHSGQGWNLIDSIPAAFPDRSIPVIVCSTRDASDACPPPSVSKYLTKPVLPKTLREKTLEIIGKKKIIGENPHE
jgi:DNA-binding response OmpR family regulator